MATGNNEMNKTIDNSTLVFHLNQDLFTYSTFNTYTNTFQTIKSYQIDSETNYEDNIENIIKNDTTLKLKHTKTLGTIISEQSTFIPDLFFNKKHLHNYLHFNQTVNNNNDYLYTKQQFVNCYSVFTINNKLENILDNSFNKLKLKTFDSVFVDYAVHLNTKNKTEIFTYITKNNLFITLIKNKKFIFFNQFHFNNNDEFLYYFINCLEVLKINALTTTINIMSSLEKNHTIFNILKKYIKKIHFTKRPNKFLYGDTIMSKNEHLNHNLFSQIICE